MWVEHIQCRMIVAGLFGLSAAVCVADPEPTVLVSVNSAGSATTENSSEPAISANGRFVAFHSRGVLVAPDTNSGDYKDDDVFVRDVTSGTLVRVSVTSAGDEASGESWEASLSADGARVVFTSSARLDPGASMAYRGVYMHDLTTASTVLISKSSSGTSANRSCQNATVSAQGNHVAFASRASNLVTGDTNEMWDVFLTPSVGDGNTRISVSSSGEQANNSSSAFDQPALSENGLIVAFSSYATNLVDDDVNAVPDIFVRDVSAGATTLVSQNTTGTLGNDASGAPSLSFDGRYVAFHSTADNLVSDDTNDVMDVFVHDRVTGTTTRVSVNSTGDEGNNASQFPSISSTGRYVTFATLADNLVAGDSNASWDAVVHDRKTGVTELASANIASAVGNGHSERPAISADGRFIAFHSRATDLIADDRNFAQDVFRRDVLGPPTVPPLVVPLFPLILD